MRFKIIPLLLILHFLLFTSSPSAHKVNIFAYVEGDTIYTESYFPDGKKVKDGRIEVYDSSGNKLLEGKTNKDGQFNFKIPKIDDIKVALTSIGHKTSYTISRDELSKIKVAQIDLDKIKRIIDTSLDERLKPIIKELKKQKEASLREIIAGVGYIFGIFGIVLYIISRRR